MSRVGKRSKGLLLLACLLLAGFGAAMTARGAGAGDKISFDMGPTGAALACQPNAHGHVVVEAKHGVEKLKLKIDGLPANTGFDVFVIQVPKAPFGMSWYQGDMETNHDGRGEQTFLGRFNIETFIVAPGSAPAPPTHPLDATINPATNPVHMYHLGVWFDSPADALAAGCPGNVTPFNGEHHAGIQVLNTSGFPDNAGPLSQLG